jgi:hypothetical protein
VTLAPDTGVGEAEPPLLIVYPPSTEKAVLETLAPPVMLTADALESFTTMPQFMLTDAPLLAVNAEGDEGSST